MRDWQEIDELPKEAIEFITNALQIVENTNQVVNKERLMEFAQALSIIMEITKGKKINVSYKMNEPLKWVSSISLISRHITGLDEEKFSNAMKLASNVEVYPKTDGTVQCNLTFNGMTNLI